MARALENLPFARTTDQLRRVWVRARMHLIHSKDDRRFVDVELARNLGAIRKRADRTCNINLLFMVFSIQPMSSLIT